MSRRLKALAAQIKRECAPASWSRGVSLARGGAVVQGESDEASELVARVAIHGKVVSPTVKLWPDEEDWFCDCESKEDPCFHVAAAVAAFTSPTAGRSAGRSPERVGYRFTRGEGGLALGRVLIVGEGERPLTRSLIRQRGHSAVASRQDLALELALEGRLGGGWLTETAMGRVLEALQGAADVSLDGAPVKVAGPRSSVVARLRDEGVGFRLSVEADPAAGEVFGNGALFDGAALRRCAEPPIPPRELGALRNGRYFPPDDAGRLAAEILPALEEKLNVAVSTRRLPRSADTPPRIVLEVSREGDRLEVLPTMVYGRPVVARVLGGTLELRDRAAVVPIRDPREERRLTRELALGLELQIGRRRREAGEAAIALAARLEPFGGAEVSGDAHRSFRVLGALEARFEPGGDDFDLTFVSGGAEPGVAELEPVLAAWSRGESTVALTSGLFGQLPLDWLERHGHRVLDLVAARRDAGGALPRCALPDLARLCQELDCPVPPRLEGLRSLLGDFSGLPRAALPEDLAASLREYQRSGVDWLCFLREAGMGALLADDMGLGKTLQALCAVPSGRSLIVAPASVVHGWAAELRRFRPGLGFSVYHGPGRALDGAAVTLTTYAILRLDREQLTAVRWDMVVLDESQTIKNPESQLAQAAFQLRANWRVALTGTPVENRLEELWSQFHFLNPGLLGGRADFRARYVDPVASGDGGAAGRLRRRIRPFLLRRLKREVERELPPKTEMVLRCQLTETERAVYDAIRVAAAGEALSRLRAGGGVMAALEALLRLRQAACHSGLVPGQEAGTSSKIELLRSRLDQVRSSGHRALVFSQWTALLDRVQPHLQADGVAFVRLDGATRDRGAVIERFQAEDGPPVMLISLKAGGVGLNLTAADHVFLLDLWWNPAAEDQAADRAHRIGQTRPVVVHRLVAEGTVEEGILELQRRKRAVAAAVLEGAEQASSLTREDLIALLE